MAQIMVRITQSGLENFKVEQSFDELAEILISTKGTHIPLTIPGSGRRLFLKESIIYILDDTPVSTEETSEPTESTL